MKPVSLLRYLFSKRTKAPMSLTHFVTNRCNAHCGHCFVERSRPMFSGKDLALGEIESLADSLRGRLYHVSLGGGEPTLREDLTDIACAYALRSQVRSMQIVSNGSDPGRLEQTVKSLLGRPLNVIVTLSVDEIGETHDEVRRLPGLFASLLESYRRLSPFRNRGLSLNANFTLTRRNSGRAPAILDEAMNLMPEASFSLTAERTPSAGPNGSGIDPHAYARAVDLIRRRTRAGQPQVYGNFTFGRRLLSARNVMLNRVIERTLAGTGPAGRCYAGRLTGVLAADGGVYPCEMLQRPFGNVRDSDLDFREVWRSAAGAEARRSIDTAACSCTYECAWGVNVLFDVRRLPRLVATMAKPGGRHGFTQHHHTLPR